MRALRLALALFAGLFALASFTAPAPAASSRVGASAGYDSDADDGEGDGWAAASAGHAFDLAKEGRLSASLDVAAGAVAFARLTDLDRLWVELRPEVGYVLSPRVDARLALSAEARLVEDGARSSLGWGAAAKLRERLTGDLDVTEYVSWRELRARDDAYSERALAIGCSLYTLLGDRWSLGAGLELAFGDLAGAASAGGGMRMHRAADREPGAGGGGMGSGMGSGAGGGSGTGDGDDTLSPALSAGYDWTPSLSSFVEYVATFGLDGGTEHAASAGTTWRF